MNISINTIGKKAQPVPIVLHPQRLGLRLLRLICNVLSNFIHFFFVYVYPYREKVIMENFKKAFPRVGHQERVRLLNAYYRHLSDLLTEPFLVSLCPRKDLQSLVRYENVSVVNDILDSGKDVVLMVSHCGNWEYLLSLPLELNGKVITAYSELSNRWLNGQLRKVRGKYGMSLIEKKSWYKYSMQCDTDTPHVFLSVADQRPVGISKETVSFLNQKTYVQSGAARLASNRDAVVVYLDVRKLERNVYSFRFIKMTANSGSNGCMEEYYTLLERTIKREPSIWLWSHNRWKFA